MRKLSQEQFKCFSLIVLDYIDRVCQKNKLRYFINFGTLIGAVRHGGFIPWDDDIDICMPREDYSVFLKIVEQEGSYTVLHDGNTPYYYFSFARICDKNTLLKFHGIPNVENMGAFVDVFPIDNVPENQREREELYASIKKMDADLRLILPKKYYRTAYLKEKIKRLLYFRRIRKLKKIGFEKLVDKRNKLMRKYEGKTDYLSCLCPPTNDKMMFQKHVYLDYCRMAFENIEVYAPIQYDEILKKYYGDYMQLPPIKDQKSHHHFKAYIKGNPFSFSKEKLFVSKENCCGCFACYNTCPVQAIVMLPDEEGFLYPFVTDRCIHCKKCFKVCAFNSDQKEKGFSND